MLIAPSPGSAFVSPPPVPSWNCVFLTCSRPFFFPIPPFKELLRKENIVIAHFNWPRGSRLAVLAHPAVESVFHSSEIALFTARLRMIMRALLSTLAPED